MTRIWPKQAILMNPTHTHTHITPPHTHTQTHITPPHTHTHAHITHTSKYKHSVQIVCSVPCNKFAAFTRDKLVNSPQVLVLRAPERKSGIEQTMNVNIMNIMRS